MNDTDATTIVIRTDELGHWKWGVTVGSGDGAKSLHGVADGPHQASEMAIHVREQLLREQEIRKTHYRNEQGGEIVVRKIHHDHNGTDVEALWVQWYTGDAFTYIRKVDLLRSIEMIERTGANFYHLLDLIKSF